ncbi:MAG: hypothetical protein ACRCU2_31505 [Planktothrix sp.]
MFLDNYRRKEHTVITQWKPNLYRDTPPIVSVIIRFSDSHYGVKPRTKKRSSSIKRPVDWIEFTICEYYLGALINGDWSALDQREAIRLNHWLTSLENILPIPGLWDWEDNSENYSRCDVSGLGGATVKVRWVIM